MQKVITSARFAPLSAVAGAMLLAAGCDGAPDPGLECDTGAYLADSGEVLVITPSSDDTLRYRFMDGRSGRLYRDGKGGWESGDGWAVREPVTVQVALDGCAGPAIRLLHDGNPDFEGRRVALNATPVQFEGAGGTLLSGRLVTPNGPLRATVVLAHGSERDAATRFYPWQHLLPLHGIAVLVFDKRGTGESGGKYTQDFHVLAEDVAAAVAQARALLASGPQVPVGLLGGSQGGWVAPLAATRAPVDFAIAAYGMAESPLAEDREEVLGGLARRGYGEEVLAKARRLTDATGRVMASRFRDGLQDLARVKREYRDEPWLAEVEGEFTRDFVRYPGWLLRVAGPWFDLGTTWDHDPVPVLESLDVPVLWILGGRDTEAPMAGTLAILRSLQAQGRPIDIAVFPDAEHGIIEVAGEGPTQRLVGHSPGYFELTIHWILTRNLEGVFGNAELLARHIATPSPVSQD